MSSNSSVSIERRAVIDVGTNSVKLLVADVNGDIVVPINEQAIQTRLGVGLNENGVLKKDAIERTAEAIGKFIQIAEDSGAKRIKIIGTSAVRESANCNELLELVKNRFGKEMIVISGEKEAELVFNGIIDNKGNFENKRILIVDVGGGSSEFIVGKNNKIEFLKSYPFGVVKYMQMFNISNPPERSEFLHCRNKILCELQNSVLKDLKKTNDHSKEPFDCIVATGGTITILGRMILRDNKFIREKLDNLKISILEIKNILNTVWNLPLEKRKEIPGLPPDKADVILYGVLIYEILMEELNLNSVFVNTGGLRFAAIKDFK